MRSWFRVAALVGAVVVVVLCGPPAVAGRSWTPGDDTVKVMAWQGEREYRDFLRSDPARQLKDFKRSAACLYPPAASRPCPQLDPSLPPLSLTCEGGAPVPPLWRRDRVSVEDEFGDDWYVYVDWSCPEDLFPPFTEEDLRALEVAALPVHHQPASGPILVRKPTIVFAEPEERELHAVLFGEYGVDVVVTPRSYAWDFGDGATLTTVEPGRPYPDFDITHTYREPGSHAISLTTAWSGRYRFEDDPSGRWRDVEGTVHTVDVGDPFEVVELRSRLVGS